MREGAVRSQCQADLQSGSSIFHKVAPHRPASGPKGKAKTAGVSLRRLISRTGPGVSQLHCGPNTAAPACVNKVVVGQGVRCLRPSPRPTAGPCRAAETMGPTAWRLYMDTSAHPPRGSGPAGTAPLPHFQVSPRWLSLLSQGCPQGRARVLLLPLPRQLPQGPAQTRDPTC